MNALHRRHVVADRPLRPGLQRQRSFSSLAMGRPARSCCYEADHSMETKLLSAWHQVSASKACFHKLKQDLLKGMAEANDIFNSMSIPLVRLVGLKMQELSAEGRQTSISLSPPLHSEILQACSPPDLCSDNRNKRCSEAWQSAAVSRPEDNLTAKAAHHAAEFSLLQKQQLRQLVDVVKMVEKLVRSQEESIAGRFQDCENYLESLQQSGLLNFKNLHQQVMDMRQRDSLVTYRLRVAEQSYQALMSLAVKIQENGIEKVKRNLHNVKAEVERMVNELASSMCKPLIAFLKEMKGDNGTIMGASKMQRLVTEMDSKISLEVQTLMTANNEYKAQVKKFEFQLQTCNKELEKMTLDGEIMHRSLKEKVEEIEALKVELAVEAAEKQSYKSRLDSEIARACRLEEEVKHNKAKLTDAVKLLQVTKLQLAHEHSQVEDAYTKSKELCNQLSNVEIRLRQTQAAVTSYLHGDVEITKDSDSDQPAHVHQPDRVCSKAVLNKQIYWHLWQEASQLLSTEMVEMQSGCLDKVLLQEAVVLLAKHFQKPSEVQKEENLLNSSALPEQQMKNVVNWLANARDIQELEQSFSQKAQDNIVTDLMYLKNEVFKRGEVNDSTDSDNTDPGEVTLGFWLPMFFLLAHLNGCRPNQGMSSVLAWSNICSQGLKDIVSELCVGIPEMSKPCNSLCQLLAAVGLTTILKTEFVGSQAGSSCSTYGALPQQQQEQQRSEMIQHDDHEIKLLKYESLSQLASLSQEVCGSKRKSSNSHIEEQINGMDLMQLSAKKVHTCMEAEDTRLRSQTQICPSPDLVDEHQTMRSKNGMVTREGQSGEESLSILKNGMVTREGQNYKCKGAEDTRLQPQTQKCSFSDVGDEHQTIKSKNGMVTKEGQNDDKSLSILLPTQKDILMRGESKNTINHHSSFLAMADKTEVNIYSNLATVEGNKGLNSYSATLLLSNEEKGSPNKSAKELWQVLELGTDINCNDTKTYIKNGKSTALDLSLATSRVNKQHSAEPLLFLRDDVKQLPRSISKRASPRLLARRLTDSTYSCYR